MRREIRRKRSILSFGDIILPFVGVVAIGLLVVAGRLFFINGLQPSPSIASTRQDLDIPDAPLVPSLPTIDAGTPVPLPDGQSGAPRPLAPPRYDIMDIPYGGNAPIQKPRPPEAMKQPGPTPQLEVIAIPVEAAPPASIRPSEGEAQDSARPKVVAIKPTPSQGTKPEPSKPKQQPKPAPKKPQQQAPVWRVQVGAWGTKSAAEDTVRKLAKAGYTATVFSGPKFHKVWVQAGNTKQTAEAMASRLKKSGYPGSYVVPPPSR